MPTSDYVLNPSVASTLVASADYNENIHDVEDTLLATATGVLSGAAVTNGGGLVANVALGSFLLGVKVTKAATTVALAASATNYIFVVTDPDHAEKAVYVANTTGTPPARSALVATVVTGATTITTIDNAPAGRNDVTELGALSERVDGTLAKAISGATVLTAAEAAHLVITLTGTLAAGADLTLPTTAGRRWIVVNSTTGGFAVTARTAAGTGIAIAAGFAGAVRCDGTNIVADGPLVTAAGAVSILGALTVSGALTASGALTVTGALTLQADSTLNDGVDLALGTTTGTKCGTGPTQKFGLYGVAPVAQPAGADQAAVVLGNTDNEIGGLVISAAYSQAEVTALRDKCEELADDVRALSTLIHAERTALVAVGVMKGAA